MTTIQDVARRAGVSASTVSNVLNRRTNRMGGQTLARVQAAIEALGFVPNRAARQLKTGRSSMLGLLVPSIANPMYGFIAREIESVAQERHGLRVVLGNTSRDARKETAFFDDLLAHGVRGVVVISSLADEQHFADAAARGLALVSYDRRAAPSNGPRIDHVSVDNAAAARLATAHLVAHGHARILFASVAGQTLSRAEKIAGFLAVSREAGLGRGARVVEMRTASAYGDAEMADAGRRLAARIARQSRPPTGVVALNDMLALGLIAGLRDAGLAVPADVSVVGMDDLFLSSLVTPALSSVRLPLAAMAQTVVGRVVARLADPSLPPEEFVFPPELVARRSVAPPRASPP